MDESPRGDHRTEVSGVSCLLSRSFARCGPSLSRGERRLERLAEFVDLGGMNEIWEERRQPGPPQSDYPHSVVAARIQQTLQPLWVNLPQVDSSFVPKLIALGRFLDISGMNQVPNVSVGRIQMLNDVVIEDLNRERTGDDIDRRKHHKQQRCEDRSQFVGAAPSPELNRGLLG